MGDWIGLGVFLLVIAGAVAGLAYLGKPRPLSQEEFERRAAEARGTMSAGVAGLMYALQKLMNPKAAEAVEVQKDLRAGFYDDELGHDGGGRREDEGEADWKRGGDEPALRRREQELTAEEEDEKDA